MGKFRNIANTSVSNRISSSEAEEKRVKKPPMVQTGLLGHMGEISVIAQLRFSTLVL